MSDRRIADDTAKTLTEFWHELLAVQVIRPDDRLLEAGGNSLIATMLANRIELAWGFRPTMEELMTSSFQELAEQCERSRANAVS